LSSLERVGLGLSRGKWALGNTVDTIGANTVQLTNTMPVHTGSVVLHGVLDSDTDHITPGRLDDRTRVLAVDEQTRRAAIAIRVTRGVGDLEVIRDGVAGGRVFLVKVGSNAEAIAPARSSKGTIGASSICDQR